MVSGRLEPLVVYGLWNTGATRPRVRNGLEYVRDSRQVPGLHAPVAVDVVPAV
jgi:hypothetical protein